MAASYSYFQYSPDITRDERVTFGVITFDRDGGESVMQFLEDWSRVEAFALCDPNFLREFAADMLSKPPSGEDVRKWARQWQNSIIVTEPRASILTKEVLLERMVPRALTEPFKAGYTITVSPCSSDG